MSEQPANSVEFDSGGSTFARGAVSFSQLISVELSNSHNTTLFRCAKSPRVAAFFGNEAALLISRLFCKVFVAPDPSDPKRIWGFYTLAGTTIKNENTSPDDVDWATASIDRIPSPMALIGFMGRDDDAPPGFGRVILIDAARRIFCQDIACRGILLNPEGGQSNAGLWNWYLRQGFRPCKKNGNALYAPLSAFLPELQTARP